MWAYPQALPIWDKIFTHPFLREVQAGTLAIEKFRGYIVQDYHYLEGFGRTVAVALSKAPDTSAMRRLARRVTTPIERPLHAEMFELVELSEEEAMRVEPSPTTRAYVNHMLTAAWTGGTAEAGESVREAMRRAFLTSSRYEYLFWTMAYNEERWPV